MEERRQGVHEMNIIICVYILLYVAFFICVEVLQLVREIQREGNVIIGTVKHCSDIPNIIEVLNLFSLAIVHTCGLLYEKDPLPTWFWLVLSISSLIIWVKLFFFMRAYDRTSFFIIMLQNILYEIYPFLKVMFVAVLAFASSFNYHSKYIRELKQAEEN